MAPLLHAGDAPDWMRSLVNVPVPAHDPKTEAVLLYSETDLTVQSDGKIKTVDRRAYKILRPDGDAFGIATIPYDSETRITKLQGWCIPAQGKDHEVKDKDAIDLPLNIDGSELVSDARQRILKIPEAEPGNIVGYEWEHEDRPYLLQDWWYFQKTVPVVDSRYSLQLPAGWSYKLSWLNHSEIAPTSAGGNNWQWEAHDVPAIKAEDDMPAWQGLAGAMFVSLVPPDSTRGKTLLSWNDVATWYLGLTSDRQAVSPEIKQKVTELTAASPTPLAKVQALAQFVQRDVRYVAIELGIGGYQPHPAADVYAKRFGDCKDKVTLLKTMLKESGLDSYYVIVDTERGAVSPQMPPSPHFDHVIIAIPLPPSAQDVSLQATSDDPKLGKLLFFDPTDELTPFGELSGTLQGGYGLLAAPGDAQLVQLPQLAPSVSGVERTAKLSLDANGNLTGDVHEVRRGDSATWQRSALRSASQASDRIKPIEYLLAHSFASYHLTKATMTNFDHISRPFGYDYSFVSEDYAKKAGGLLLVRPHVLGEMSSALLETREPRQNPVVFDGLAKNTDDFQITLPPGYTVDDLPDPTNIDYPFASYHSKTTVQGNILHYTCTFEIKQLTVPMAQIGDLKKFYRTIETDEQSAAVLKPQ